MYGKSFKNRAKKGKTRKVMGQWKGERFESWVEYYMTFTHKRDAIACRDEMRNEHGANHVRVFPIEGGYEVWIND